MKRVTNNLRFVLLAICGVILGISGCSSSQDGGGGSPSVQLTGAVIDGGIASGIIWVDRNDNGELNAASEPFARTDADGYFSRSPKSGTNYCTDADPDNDIYCLRSTGLERGSTVVVRVTQGYDVFTGEPFHGTLSFRVRVGDDGTINRLVVTPITTLLVHLDAAQLETFRADVQGDAGVEITVADLQSDFILITDNAKRAKLFRTALKIQKFLEPLIRQLANAYEDERPSVIYRRAFGVLAKALADKNGDLTATLTGDITVDGATKSVARHILDEVQNQLTGQKAPKLAAEVSAAVSANVKVVVETIDAVVTQSDVPADDLPKIERVIQVAVDISGEQEDNFDKAIELAKDSAADGYQAKLAQESVDLEDVKRKIVAGTITMAGDVEDYSNRPCLGDNYKGGGWTENGGAICGYDVPLKGKKLKIKEFQEGAFTDNEATLYFLDGDANGGNLVVCATYSDGNNSDNRLELDNEKLEGSWSRINRYSVVGNILVDGIPESFIVKSVNYLHSTNGIVDFKLPDQ